MTDVQSLTDALIAADRKTPIANQPTWMPTTAADAIGVQQAVVAGRTVRAWKVARNAALGPVAAPMLRLVTATKQTAHYDLSHTSSVEPEIALLLSRDLAPLPNGAQHTVQTLMDHTASIHMGIELLEHRLSLELRKAHFPLALADAMNNGGYVIGPDLPRDRVLALIADPVGQNPDLTLTFDGEIAVSGPFQHVDGNPLLPLLDLLNDAAARERRGEADRFWTFKAGNIVTTGSFGPAIPLNGATTVALDWLAQLVINPRG